MSSRLIKVAMVVMVNSEAEAWGSEIYDQDEVTAADTMKRVIEDHGKGSNQTQPFHVLAVHVVDLYDETDDLLDS